MAQTEVQTDASAAPKLTRKDFASDQEVRWCPGCGDYSILAQLQRALAEVGIPREKTVFVSGIGCSSRFPYYMNTYGFHTIHGRAPAVASGIKCANTDLSVWVMTGDGDGLSIGGNQMLHMLRRNMDVKVILFNNRIYGLTKGQTSPTSEVGKVTRSTPMGSIEQPILPISFALAAEATFVARGIDSEPAHLQELFKRAANHTGAAFIEVLQNCVIFNDGAWNALTDKETKADNLLFLEHGKPMVYGRNRDKGFLLNGYRLETVKLGGPANEFGYTESDLLIHNEECHTSLLAYILSRTDRLGLPTPIGVFHSIERPTYDAMLESQVEEANKQDKRALLKKLLHSGQTWEIGGNGDGA
jgi:2-oxoglutarate ferredoxin oxidoreductase subunit beta